MNVKHRNVDMTGGPLVLNLLRFALPLMAANLMQRAFNTADVIVVGRFAGDTALAAVTSTTSLINMILSLFSGLSMGTNVVAARALGEGNGKRVRETVHTSILLSLLCGTALMIFGILAAGTILRWMSSPENVIGQSTIYLRLYFLGVPTTLLYNFGSALLRANGDTRRPMLYLMLAGILNVGLNLVFVLVFHMSVAGVGLATALSHFLSGGLVLRALLQESGALHLDLRQLRIHGESALQILRIGVPASVQGVLTSMSNVIIQSSVNSLGEAVMAGNGASSNLDGFIWTAMNGFTQAGLTFTSRNLGARQLRRIDLIHRRCLLMAFITGIALSAGGLLLGRQLLGIYISGEEAIGYGLLRMRITFPLYFLLGMVDVLVGCQRGLGSSIPPMLLSMLGMCGFRVLWVFTVFRMDPTAQILFTSYPVSWALTAAAQAVSLYFVRRKVFAAARRELAEGNG